jgi:hypothetical protein
MCTAGYNITQSFFTTLSLLKTRSPELFKDSPGAPKVFNTLQAFALLVWKSLKVHCPTLLGAL